MYAQNPKTGKPIRIMRSDASLWRSQKTMIWLQNQDPQATWSRWETLVEGMDDLKKWESAQHRMDYVVLTSSTDEGVEWFKAMDETKYKMIFMTRELVLKMGVDVFRAKRVPNVLILEELYRMYPFVGYDWDGSREDAVFLAAILMRMPRTVDGKPPQKRMDQLKQNGIVIEHQLDTQPRQLWFFTQFYKPAKARRAKEIRKCLDENVKCSVIDKIVLLNESDFTADLPTSSKIEQVVIGKRLTYYDVIDYISKSVPKDSICVFANADIYLDNGSWKEAWSVKLEDTFLALLRWDVQEDGSPSKIFGPRNDSQDTWCILSDSVQSRQWEKTSLDIPFGKAGCDNAITVEMLRKKFLVTNPALTLKTHHLHVSNIRNYDVADVVDKPMYMYVDPSGIHDMEPVFDLQGIQSKVETCASFSRSVFSAQPRVLDTYCKMLERGERYAWTAKDTNLYPTTTIPFYKYSNVFQTPQGLVYGYNRLYIGREEVSKEAWSKSQLSCITPAFHVKRCFVAPWREDDVKTHEAYVLHYLSKILWMRKMFGDGEFWAPGKDSLPALELFDWQSPSVPVIPHTDKAQVWCEEAIQYPWLAQQEIHKEELDILRSSLRDAWKESVATETPRWVVMVDGTKITADMVRRWESAYPAYEWGVVFENRTSPERIIEKLRGSSGFICYGGPNSVTRWGFSWALPRKATLIEVQNEMEPNGEAAHVSGAAELRHSFVIVPRASEKATQEAIDKNVCITLDSLQDSQAMNETRLPIVRIPRASLTGFFGHAGDSFREMVHIWEERGYIRVVEDTTSVQVWLGEVGDTLLYDRPTLDWLFAAPAAEQTWRQALFGNPKPTDSGGPATSWFFWPRRPQLVEAAVEKGLPQKGWSQRTKTVVFYGKVENKVQEKRRLAQDWSSACDEFVCTKGETATYQFSQAEYLEKLADAKFGLCLAGFGKKCHREVECMAMGCVPLVAPDVDMQNYANPPKEGVQYLRVKSPEDAKEQVASMSESQWLSMSAACQEWWRDNASAEGSWKLTQKLKAV